MSLRKIYYPIIFALVSLPLLFLPLIQVTRVTTYTTWFPDGTTESKTEQTTNWISLYQYLLEGGKLVYYTNQSKTLDELKKALNKAHFKLEYTQDSQFQCGEKSAIIMKYLKEKGFTVEMARGKLVRGDEEIPHAWVLVHLKDDTYVVETNTQSGYPDVVGKVQEAAQGSLRYVENTRWDMKKVEEKYKDLLKEPLNEYLEIEK